MKILIAGATGAAGQALIPYLTEHGHDVIGTTRGPAKPGLITMDGLDLESVTLSIDSTNPDVIVHQMTALPGHEVRQARQDVRGHEPAAHGGHARTSSPRPGAAIVSQSFAGWPYARTGGAVKTEDDPLDPAPPKGVQETHRAIRELERLTTEANGIVLRYGGFYGPGERCAAT